MADQKRILISRPDRIGDVVLSTSLPREIKKQFPDSYVAVLVREYTKDIYSNNPNVDRIILIDDFKSDVRNNFFKKVRELRDEKFTHSLSLLPTERINYLLFFAGIPNRIGVGHKFYQFITNTKSVYRHKYNPLRHEADYCLDLVRKIGVESKNFLPEIHLTEEEKQGITFLRRRYLTGKKYLIGIHTSNGNSAPNWSTEDYRYLIKELQNNPAYSVVVTDQSKGEMTNIPGVEFPCIDLTLREAVLRFAALDVLVSSSTGPMHICAALKIKTVSMFCPLTACSPKLWGPLGNVSEILMPKYSYCQYKCPGSPKKCLFEGEQGIGVSDAVEKIEGILLQ